MNNNALVRNPIYHQLTDVLRGLIRKGEFKDGQQFLTERQVGERFGISRITANKALASLVAEGVLEFRKGVGTFVRGSVLDFDLARLVSFTSKAKAAGRKPKTKVLHFAETTAAKLTPELRAALLLSGPEAVFEMKRLRMADGVPVILERRYVSKALVPRLSKADAEGSIYEALIGRHDVEMSGADQRVRAINLRGVEAELLQVPVGTAGLLVIGIGFAQGNQPLWYEETLYRGDTYELHSKVGPLSRVSALTGDLVGAKSGNS